MLDILHLFIEGAQRPVISYILIASLVDIFMGLIKAGIGRTFNSTISSAGILKHIAMIAVPILTSPLFDLVDGGALYWNAFTGLILVTMLVSIVENWIAVGLPFPETLKKFLDNKKIEIVQPQPLDAKVPGEAKEIKKEESEENEKK
mgnify:CR=1 FL=1